MSEYLFNIQILSNTLEKYNIHPNETNCYLFFLFFMERSQLVASIVKKIDPEIKNSLSIGIKYCIINESNEKIIKKIKEYKNDFDKNELINELIKFIKNTVDDKKIELIKNDTSEERISKLFNSFKNIKYILNYFDDNGIEEDEIYELLQSDFEINEEVLNKLKDEIKNLDISWEKNNKKSEIYMLIKNWI